MSSVMARTPTVTRHSDFMAAAVAAAAEQGAPGLRRAGAPGAGALRAPPDSAGRSRSRHRHRPSPGDAVPGMLSRLTGAVSRSNGGWFLPARTPGTAGSLLDPRWGWRCQSASLGAAGSAKRPSGKQAQEIHSAIIGGKLAGRERHLQQELSQPWMSCQPLPTAAFLRHERKESLRHRAPTARPISGLPAALVFPQSRVSSPPNHEAGSLTAAS